MIHYRVELTEEERVEALGKGVERVEHDTKGSGSEVNTAGGTEMTEGGEHIWREKERQRREEE
jgi:hypothetical protein